VVNQDVPETDYPAVPGNPRGQRIIRACQLGQRFTDYFELALDSDRRSTSPS
jgi:hypothetical protein